MSLRNGYSVAVVSCFYRHARGRNVVQTNTRIVYIIKHVGCCIDSVYGTSGLGSLYPYVCLYTLLLLLYMYPCCGLLWVIDSEPLATSFPTSMLVILVSLNPIVSNYLELLLC